MNSIIALALLLLSKQQSNAQNKRIIDPKEGKTTATTVITPENTTTTTTAGNIMLTIPQGSLPPGTTFNFSINVPKSTSDTPPLQNVVVTTIKPTATAKPKTP